MRECVIRAMLLLCVVVCIYVVLKVYVHVCNV